MYNNVILDLILMLPRFFVSSGYSAGGFGGPYFGQSYFGDGNGALNPVVTAMLYELSLLGVG